MVLHMYQVGIAVLIVNAHVPSWYNWTSPIKSMVSRRCVMIVRLSKSRNKKENKNERRIQKSYQ